MMQCSFGRVPSSLLVLLTNQVFKQDVPDDNIIDHVPLVNIYAVRDVYVPTLW
jgi:hypothetical protein